VPETGTTRGMQELDTIEDQTISTLTEILKPQQVPPRVLKPTLPNPATTAIAFLRSCSIVLNSTSACKMCRLRYRHRAKVRPRGRPFPVRRLPTNHSPPHREGVGQFPITPIRDRKKTKFGSLSADFRAGVGALMLPERGTLPEVTVTARARRGIGRKARPTATGHGTAPHVQPRSATKFPLDVLAIQIGINAPSRAYQASASHAAIFRLTSHPSNRLP